MEGLANRDELNGLGARVNQVELRQAEQNVEISHTKEDVKEIWSAVDAIRATITGMTGKIGIIVGTVTAISQAVFFVLQFIARR